MSLDTALGQLVDDKKLNDETLLRLIAQAQESALGELYDRYSRLVYSMALNSVDDPVLAEEITQDVFLRIWNKATTYQVEQGKVITWIASITRYRSIDMLRRLKVRPEGNRSAWAEEDAEPFESIDPIDIEEEVQLNQRSDNIRKAIADLPKDQRQALTLAFFNGYTHAEIAQILNEPLGTIKTRIRLAMQKLRQTLRY
jgi:RNA polymerase sigma-70 factor, ECF subfamily